MTDMRRAYLERVTAPVIAKGHIQQMYQAVYPLAYGSQPRGKRMSLTAADASEIVAALESRGDGGPLVTPEQCKQGADWLVRYGRKLGLPDDLVGKEPAYFRFPCCTETYTDSIGFMYFLPVYTAYYPDGTRLRYMARAWQSGAYFEHTVERAA